MNTDTAAAVDCTLFARTKCENVFLDEFGPVRTSGHYRTVLRTSTFVSTGGMHMTRHLATVALIVCLFPAALYADTAEFTISSASANVHKAPTTASPVIGRTSRGQVLPVKRELGSWVRV